RTGRRARPITRGLFLEKCDDVRAIPRIVDREGHLGSGDEPRRVGEPLVERGLAPDDVRGLQGGRVVVVRDTAGLASEDIPMLGSDLVLVERVADHAILIDFRSMGRISRRETWRR